MNNEQIIHLAREAGIDPFDALSDRFQTFVTLVQHYTLEEAAATKRDKPSEAVCDVHQRIDMFLRNNRCYDDYADLSCDLELCWPGETPPRLTDEQVKKLIPEGDDWKYEIGIEEAIEFARDIETAVRKQFLGDRDE